MLYYIILAVIIALFCYMEYSEKKTNCQNAQKLKKEFDDWIDSAGETKKPSNALFTELYKMRYGKEIFTQPVVELKGRTIYQNKVDVIASFPSLNTAILGAQVTFIENLESYYTLEYEKVKSIGYFIHYVCSLPLRLLKYLGLDEEKTANKLLQIILWIFSLFLPQIKDLVLAFINFMLSKK